MQLARPWSRFVFWPRLLRLVLTPFMLALFTSETYALPFTTGRGGAGYSFLEGDKGKSSSTATVSGTGRFGYKWDEDKYFAAVDVTAYRFYKNKVFKEHQDGNNGLLVLGMEFSGSTYWLAAGAGEIRSYDRAEEKSRPYRYLVMEQQLGFSYQIYTADYARVEIGATLDRMTPDEEWVAKTGIASINSLQIDIGFKLFNW